MPALAKVHTQWPETYNIYASSLQLIQVAIDTDPMGHLLPTSTPRPQNFMVTRAVITSISLVISLPVHVQIVPATIRQQRLMVGRLGDEEGGSGRPDHNPVHLMVRNIPAGGGYPLPGEAQHNREDIKGGMGGGV